MVVATGRRLIISSIWRLLKTFSPPRNHLRWSSRKKYSGHLRRSSSAVANLSKKASHRGTQQKRSIFWLRESWTGATFIPRRKVPKPNTKLDWSPNATQHFASNFLTSTASQPRVERRGALDGSPQREQWVKLAFKSSVRSDRIIPRARAHFLSPLRGLRFFYSEPTASAVSRNYPPPRGFQNRF